MYSAIKSEDTEALYNNDDEHLRTPALMPGTHCQNTCDKPLRSTFSSAKNVFIRADIALSALETFLFSGLYKFTLLTYLLTYLLTINFIACGCSCR